MKWLPLLLIAVLSVDVALPAVALHRTYPERTLLYRSRAKRQLDMPVPFVSQYRTVLPGSGWENMDMNMNQFGGVSVGGTSYTVSIG
uniref:Peptidase M23 n=1 Tax=Ascaris lumbricoides TaxID=6252 RepID=A0A0M3IRL7_ASCLU